MTDDPHPLCRPVPEIRPDDVDDHSITTCPGGGPYAPSVEFEANGRHFYLVDKNEDGTVDLPFSIGPGPEFCVDHDAIPESVLEHVEEWAEPLALDIPDEFREVADA